MTLAIYSLLVLIAALLAYVVLRNVATAGWALLTALRKGRRG
jgi:hypothetical protein